MKQYLNLLRDVLMDGEEREDRTGTGTLSLFGAQLRFDLNKGFPILTTKKVNFHAVATELCWMLKGDTNIKYLNDHNVHIWDEWADENGDLGLIYGHQWRRHNNHKMYDKEYGQWDYFYTDQIKDLCENLIQNPYSRRHIVNCWQLQDLQFMALPPCHTMFQMYVSNDNKLSCHMYQRSADMFLGVPFNIAQYALLTYIVAVYCGYTVGDLIISYGDAHIYKNHIKQVELQLEREPKDLPILNFRVLIYNTASFLDRDDQKLFIDSYDPEHFSLSGYDPHTFIKGAVSV